MEQKHTSEPWKAVRNNSFWEVVTHWPDQALEEADTYSPSVAYVWGNTEDEAESNARRIVACVNACAGFSNEELEGASLYRDSFDAQNEIDELRADIATAEQDSRQKQARIDRLSDQRVVEKAKGIS